MARVLVFLLLLGAQAQAGPWPRGKGKVFYSIHANGEYIENLGLIRQYGSLYAEYGLTEQITLGVDYSGSEITTEKAIAFARFPIPNKDRALRIAAEIGVGVAEGDMAVRPGLSIGRGITWGKRTGWMTLDTRALLSNNTANSRIEADFTFGLNASERIKVILQLQAGMPSEGDTYLKFAPSVVYELKPRKSRKSRRKKKTRKGKQFIEFGLTAGLHNYDNYAAKVGIWREF